MRHGLASPSVAELRASATHLEQQFVEAPAPDQRLRSVRMRWQRGGEWASALPEARRGGGRASALAQQLSADALPLEAARYHEVGEQRALPDVSRRVAAAVLVEPRDLYAAAANDPTASLSHQQRVWPRVEPREALNEVLVHGVAQLALGALVGRRAEQVLRAQQRDRHEDLRRQQLAAAGTPDADGRRDRSVARLSSRCRAGSERYR